MQVSMKNGKLVPSCKSAPIGNLEDRLSSVMGIQGLMKLIGDYAPAAVKDNDIKSYFGKV